MEKARQERNQNMKEYYEIGPNDSDGESGYEQAVNRPGPYDDDDEQAVNRPGPEDSDPPED